LKWRLLRGFGQVSLRIKPPAATTLTGDVMKKKSPSSKIALPAPDFTPKPTGKPATILYKKLPDDMILITGFEGFLSLDEIFDKYGRVVATTYSGYSYYIYGMPGSIFVSGLAAFGAVRTGQIYNKVEFSHLIAHVKKCGVLLHDIIQAVNAGEVKRIEI
jgi:hypothetical protein